MFAISSLSPNTITLMRKMENPGLRSLSSSAQHERSLLIKFGLLVLSLAESVLRMHTEKC